jgi:hypothetical protein
VKEELPALYEFAMTPDLFDASVANSDGRVSVILFELLRGIAENGLLANLHKDRWLRQAFVVKIYRPLKVERPPFALWGSPY